MPLPPNRLSTVRVTASRCAACGGIWEQQYPVPGYYTAASLDDGQLPHPICDLCVEREEPARFAMLLAHRRQFWRSS